MNNLKCILVVFTVICFVGCSEGRYEQADSQSQSQLTAPRTDSNKLRPSGTVVAFLNWYKENEDRLHEIDLVSGGLKDTTTFYSVNFKETERYLAELKKSGFLSDKYLHNLRQHFKSADDHLKRHPQNDSYAPGFEYDLIMKAQDYWELWDNLDRLQLSEQIMTDTTAYVRLAYTDYYKAKYYLSNHNNRWLIDDQVNDFYQP